MVRGLGNHDITNNHPETGGGCRYWWLPPLNLPICVIPRFDQNTCCSATMLTIQKRDLEGYIQKPQGFISLSPEGSAYSWHRGTYRFLQLNYNPALDWGTALNDIYRPPLGQYFDWFEAQLSEAQASGQNVVIYIHTLSGLSSADLDRFKRAIQTKPVSLIFVGHDHECFGQQQVLVDGGSSVPVIYSGAAEYVSYIDVSYGSQTITVALQLARGGGHRLTVVQWTYNLGPGGKVTNPQAGQAFVFNSNNRADHEPAAGSCGI
ncbi:hypothetical protein PLESTF_001569200 [Pleodorina starrii]|nr:hypothetical protein PLESTM_000948500 [Pleodorina starrii]GLC74895.1 hypothetical protein PLESTF_001569200 [Pleodorina starrii]